MAEYKESQLWTLLRNGFKKSPGIHLTRIENITSSGVPDLIMTKDNVTRFIELKVTEHKHYLYFRHAQIVWALDEIKAGGRPLCLFYYVEQKRICLVEMKDVIKSATVYNEKYKRYNIINDTNNINKEIISFAIPYQYSTIIKEIIK